MTPPQTIVRYFFFFLWKLFHHYTVRETWQKVETLSTHEMKLMLIFHHLQFWFFVISFTQNLTLFPQKTSSRSIFSTKPKTQRKEIFFTMDPSLTIARYFCCFLWRSLSFISTLYERLDNSWNTKYTRNVVDVECHHMQFSFLGFLL